MATLRASVERAQEAAGSIPLPLAAVLSVPLFVVLANQFGTKLSSMSEGEAITVFSVIGGLSGLVSQAVASQMLKRLGRPVNVLELFPAIGFSVIFSAVATLLFLPPATLGDAWSGFLEQLGLIVG